VTSGDAPELPLDPGEECVRFWIHVTPRARRTGVGGHHGDALRVAVAAAPEGGAANEACIEALAGALGVRRADVALEAGARARRKRIRVAGDPGRLAVALRDFARKSPGR
jgi:uncharacterized protein YggU (UPF0235/DUF167 family)